MNEQKALDTIIIGGGIQVVKPGTKTPDPDLAQRINLACSSSTLKQCMQWLEELGALSQAELIEVGRNNPLRVLGYRVE